MTAVAVVVSVGFFFDTLDVIRNDVLLKVSMFTIALVFLTSVVDASNIISNDMINPAKFRQMVQSISSKWSEQYGRSSTRRHLQNDAGCTWIPKAAQCTVVSTIL